MADGNRGACAKVAINQAEWAAPRSALYCAWSSRYTMYLLEWLTRA